MCSEEAESRKFSSRGIIYVASGSKYIAEAIRSRESARQMMPDVPAVLFTDNPNAVTPGVFDSTLMLRDTVGSCGDKLIPLLDSPFERSLFLDTDTYVLRPVYDIFETLERFDFLIAHEPCRWGGKGWSTSYPSLPTAFCELNTGVFAFTRGKPWEGLITRWRAAYADQIAQFPRYINDQPALQIALYEAAIRFYILPCEYNLRTNYVAFAGDEAEVKILHGREFDLQTLGQLVNRHTNARVFLWTERQIAEPVLNFMRPEKAWFRLLRRVVSAAARFRRRLRPDISS